MNYHITDENGLVLISNINSSLLSSIGECSIPSEVTHCIICRTKCRRGYIKNEFGSVYICSNEEPLVQSGSIFKKNLEIYLNFLTNLKQFRKEVSERKFEEIDNLVHNIATNNILSLQELDYFISPLERNLGETGKDFFDSLKDKISAHPEVATEVLLKIFKNERMIKYQFDLFSKPDIQEQFSPSIERHYVHRVFFIVYKLFSSGLKIEKEVRIKINEYKEMALLDFESFSTALFAIFQNIEKYILPDSDLIISFKELENKQLELRFEMVSLEVKDEEKESIFDPGYSGVAARNRGLAGRGLGLFQARTLLNLSGATINFIPNIDPTYKKRFHNSKYQKNLIKVILKK